LAQYRGNVGNLLQHWVLCEILDAGRNHAQDLAFIDAYSMAPFATERAKPDSSASLFDSVRDRLPGEQTPYERAWYELTPATAQSSGYPNSAVLLRSLWPGRYSVLLCEKDWSTAHKLKLWLNQIERSPKCVAAEVYEGDWRARFSQGVPVSSDLVLFSFDPYMFNGRPVKDPKPGNMYPDDLTRLATVVQEYPRALLFNFQPTVRIATIRRKTYWRW
jgi:hypothetical protein